MILACLNSKGSEGRSVLDDLKMSSTLSSVSLSCAARAGLRVGSLGLSTDSVLDIAYEGDLTKKLKE